MDNRVEYLAATLGANKVGVVSALINTHVAGLQLEHALTICEPRFVLLGAEHVANVEKLGEALPVARDRVLLVRDGARYEPLEGATDMDAIVDAAPATNPPESQEQSIPRPLRLHLHVGGPRASPRPR